MKAPPGMKPTPDGGFKMAGEHPETFKLENDNGAVAIVDTKKAAAISWKDANGVEVIDAKGILHCFPGEVCRTHLSFSYDQLSNIPLTYRRAP